MKLDHHLIRNFRLFTLMELLLVIAIVAILAGLLLPSLQIAKDASKGLKCKTQIKQIGQYMYMYAGDYNDFMPYCSGSTLATSYCFASNLMPSKDYIGYDAASGAARGSSIYRCPSFVQGNTFSYVSYGYNAHFSGAMKISSLPSPSKAMLLLEKDWNSLQTSNYPWYANYVTPGTNNYLGTSLGKRHNKRGNIVYADNHVGDWKNSLPNYPDIFWDGK